MTYEEAVDDVLGMLNTAWSVTGHNLYFANTRGERETDETSFAMAKIMHTDDGGQRTLGGVGYREFERVALLMVMIYVQAGKGLSEMYQLAKVVSDAFEGKTSVGGVRFRNITLRERDRDGQFAQIDVFVEFEYDEVR